MGALIISRHLEADPGTCGVLLENQGDLLAEQLRHFGTGIPGGLEVGGQFQQKADLSRGEVLQGEEAAVLQIESHGSAPVRSEGIADGRAAHAADRKSTRLNSS